MGLGPQRNDSKTFGTLTHPNGPKVMIVTIYFWRPGPLKNMPACHTMTEVVQKGQKRYSLCFNIKHDVFWHFCACIHVSNHVLSELFDYLKID